MVAGLDTGGVLELDWLFALLDFDSIFCFSCYVFILSGVRTTNLYQLFRINFAYCLFPRLYFQVFYCIYCTTLLTLFYLIYFIVFTVQPYHRIQKVCRLSCAFLLYYHIVSYST